MRLVHYSAKPVAKVRSVPVGKRGGRRFDTRGGHIADKPVGFWVSDDDCEHNWAEWCRAQSFGVERLAHRHEITLATEAKMLHLKNASDIDAFTKEHGAELYPGAMRGWIDWRPVVEAYQGIIISPYIWERRLSNGATWYYSWDCAGGVIWDAKAIAQIRHVTEAE